MRLPFFLLVSGLLAGTACAQTIPALLSAQIWSGTPSGLSFQPDSAVLIPHRKSIATTVASTYLRVIYRLDYKLDSAVATPKSEQMILRIHNGASCFQSKVQQMMDSIHIALKHLPPQEQLNYTGPVFSKMPITEIRYSIFKEPANDLVFYHDNIGLKDHQYQEKAPLFAWKIMPAKKIVAGYECQQAITTFGGRTWEAWFAREIPVSEGPYKFYGLPGLIVKVRDAHDHYVFELLSFESSPKPFDLFATSTMSASQSAPLIKKAKFKQAKLNDDLTLMAQFASWGNKIPESMQKDYFVKLKRRNNPIEIK